MSGWTPGKYKAKIKGGTCSATSKGTPQMKIELDVGGHAKHATLYFSEKAAEMSNRKLAGIGFNGDFENPTFTGDDIEVELRFEDYNGKPQERWELPWPESPPVDKTALMSLGAMFKATAGAAPPPPPPAGTRPPPPPKAPPAPSAPPPPKNQPQPTTRDKAWTTCADLANTEGVDATTKWNDAIDAVTKATGRKETEFTPEDWGAVVAEWIPF